MDDVFIRVSGGEDGTFYDLVNKINCNYHMNDLMKDGYSVSIIEKEIVPPTLYRDFTGFYTNTYTVRRWKNGKVFYHCN